jgi:hypothetical protein
MNAGVACRAGQGERDTSPHKKKSQWLLTVFTMVLQSLLKRMLEKL